MLPHKQHIPQQQDSPKQLSKRSKRRWWLVGSAIFVFLCGGGLLLWNYTPPLTSTEQELVGKWAFPMGPNPSPPNALRIVYELRPKRQLIVHYISVGGVTANEELQGSWRLENDQLILKAAGPDTRSLGNKVLQPVGAASSKFGNDTDPTRMSLRYTLLGREGRLLSIQDESGNELRLEKTDE
jgi:hypothetical protein